MNGNIWCWIAWTLSISYYLGLFWIIPLRLGINRKDRLWCVLVVHVASLLAGIVITLAVYAFEKCGLIQ